ncbi:MAG: efflux RND transporter periplasmic adaptor subunit [Patescibacteria group bacterium]|nr:efflux RND transporter periplasmic adaptor subunit [Patescibacteria group bacterium]
MKFVRALLKRKFLLAAVIIVVITGGYFIYQKVRGGTTETHYVLTQVEKGTLIVSVTGSGQVSSESEVDIKPKVSGQITKIYVSGGQAVKSGQVLAQLDSTDAQKAVRDASNSLETAQLALEKLQAPADKLSLLQAQNSLASANVALTSAQTALQKSYDDGFNAVANAFLSLPTVMTGLNDVLYSKTFYSDQPNLNYIYDSVLNLNPDVGTYKTNADSAYQTARIDYDKNFLDYKNTNRYSDTSSLEALINETYETTKAISQAVKSANDILTFYKDQLTLANKKAPAQTDTYLATLNTYTGTANSALGSLLSAQTSITTAKNSITSSQASVAEKTQSLADLQAGPDALDLRTQALSVQKSQDALTDARQTSSDYTIRAPFDGVVAKVSQKVGDQGSSGTSLATLVTTQELATVTLNEVDAAKVKTGQKATLTFDAIDGLSITGEVAEIDSLGTVSSGVVTYSTTISFDTQDDRIKPGMSVSASIITEAKPDVLLVANSAVQGSGDARYVEVLTDAPANDAALTTAGVTSSAGPQRKTVTVGSSNDTQTEITAGLSEGDLIITRTITGSSTSSTTTRSTGNILQSLNGGGPSSGGAVIRRAD